MAERYKPALGERVRIPGGRTGVIWSLGQEDNGSGGVSLGWLVIPDAPGKPAAEFVRGDHVQPVEQTIRMF